MGESSESRPDASHEDSTQKPSGFRYYKADEFIDLPPTPCSGLYSAENRTRARLHIWDDTDGWYSDLDRKSAEFRESAYYKYR